MADNITRKYTDRFGLGDDVDTDRHTHSHTLWKRTRVRGGYGRYVDRNGISQLGETIFDVENMVPILGVQYAMEKIFNVQGSLPQVYLNDTDQIGAQGSLITAETEIYPYAHGVYLFGVGCGGAASNNSTVIPVTYRENHLTTMVPFRYTNDSLTAAEQSMYYGKKVVDGTNAYYLKRFDQDPVIKHLWKDGDDGKGSTEVDSTVWKSSRTEPIETVTECYLSINKKDVREWFIMKGSIDDCLVNEFALYSGIYDPVLDDYAQIALFSKLTIPTEHLSLSKDLQIIYDIYGS